MQIVSGDITRDITGEIVYLKAYKKMVGEVTGYSTEKGTATVMSDLGRCKHTLYILKHKPEYTKGWGWRCRYCGRTYKDLREEAEYKERERRSRTW